MIGAIFENRDFTKYPRIHWEKLIVERYSKSVIGGPVLATIRATGSEKQLFEFFEMLRCPVYIIDYDRAKRVWWGKIGKVTVYSKSGLEIGVDIDSMANKLAIAYTYNKERFTTSFSSHSGSQSEYGIKELVLSAHEQTENQVNSYRANQLASRKYPTPTAPRWGSELDSAEAIIECRGWWDSLDWRYYSNDQGRIEYIQEDGRGREIGEDDRPIAAMSFQQTTGSAWTADTIWLRARKVGSPADNMLVSLWSDSGGDPNASLSGTDDVAGANLTDRLVWTEFTLDTPQSLADSTDYWVHVTRSTGIDVDNYYFIGGTELDGFADGNAKIQRTSNSTWYVWDRCQDLNFRVLGDSETTTQISNIITDVGEFFEGTDVDDTSGVNSSPFRDGDATALYEIEKLLKVGTTNDRRLLADVSDIRRVKIYEETAAWSADWHIDGLGLITDDNDTAINPADCPVGFWARLKGILPDTVDQSRLVNASHMFIESAEYDVRSGKYKILRTRDAISPLEMISIQEG